MRVLIVEDEERLARIVKDGLAEQGIEADVEHDGDSGLWRAQEASYDVIVLDIMLPGLNGYQVCKKLREAEVWTPILMLTAKDGEWDEAEALDTGADDFLSKPFSFIVLLARLRALARRNVGARPAVLAAGELTLDPSTRVVRRGDVAIDLTRREFDVLELLLRANGAPVPKREILDRVWGFDHEVDENVVEVYIRYVRKKIDDPFGTKSITTLRGVGYRVELT